VDSPVSESPKILENLVAAGLVSHELIGDPDRVATESAALGALCARIASPVYRLGAFHYAFRVGPEDLGGALAGTEPGAWGAAIEAALTAELGEEAVWINAANVAAEAEAGLDTREILFLKAGDGAVAAVLAEAPDLRAVIAAHAAARTAETASALTAEAIDGAARAAGAGAAELAASTSELGRRIEALEQGIATAIAARLGEAVTAAAKDAVADAVTDAVAGAVNAPAIAEGIARNVAEAAEEAVTRAARSAVAETVADAVAGKLEVALSAALRQAAAAKTPDPALERAATAIEAAEESARQDALASGIAALEASLEALTAATIARAAEETARAAAREAELGAFESRLGLTLAEFLARLGPVGRIVETGRTPVPAAPEAVSETAPETARPEVGEDGDEAEAFLAMRVAQGG
jgi:hypothetical protein